MQFLKRNWFLMLCGLVSLSSVGAMVGFVGCMAEIESRMAESANLYRQLEGAGSNPQNAETIAHILEVTERVKKEQSEVLDKAIKSNLREPLRTDCFPTMSDRNIVPFAFLKDYRAAFPKMMRQLNPLAPADMTNFDQPNPDDILLWQEELLRRQGEEIEQEQATVRPGPRLRSGAARGGMAEPLTPVQLALEDPMQMASIERARVLQCYVGLESFQLHEIYYQSGTFTETDMWAAQVLLWIQQDVVAALARVNQDAADALNAKNKTLPAGDTPIPVDVTTLPVKHLSLLELVLIDQVYEVGMGADPAGGIPALGSMSFTGRTSNADFDVVPFQVVLIVDQRDLSLIINEIAKANFYTALNVNYTALPAPTRDDAAIGYLYGHEPIVQAELDFEGYFFREAYHHRWPEGGPRQVEPGEPPDALTDHPFMPQAVSAALSGAEGMMGMSGMHAGFALSQPGQGGFGIVGGSAGGFGGARGGGHGGRN